MPVRRFLLLAAVCGLALLAACAPKVVPPTSGFAPTAGLALAGFSNPRLAYEMVDGCLPERCSVSQPDVLERANAILVEELMARHRSFGSIQAVRQCQEIILLEQGLRSSPTSALDYWIKVGRCVPTDFLLVPQLLFYRDRVGGSLGVEQPAGVVVHFYLVDVKNQRVAAKFFFDETQRSLSENLLDLGKFVKRHGQWVTADDLLREAAQAAIRELKL